MHKTREIGAGLQYTGDHTLLEVMSSSGKSRKVSPKVLDVCAEALTETFRQNECLNTTTSLPTTKTQPKPKTVGPASLGRWRAMTPVAPVTGQYAVAMEFIAPGRTYIGLYQGLSTLGYTHPEGLWTHYQQTYACHTDK